jgi:hypothetical protein
MGEHHRAMEAALRVDQFDPTSQFMLLGDAGRYALAAGDSAIAVWALNWYLPTRANAEPHLRARDDELREGLARLVGERR